MKHVEGTGFEKHFHRQPEKKTFKTSPHIGEMLWDRIYGSIITFT